jgi:hypothetical protein
MMANLLTLLGLVLNFAGALLITVFRLPGLEVTSDGKSVAQGQAEPMPDERSKNLRRYWRNAAATKVGLICLCAGFAFQILGFLYPDTGNGGTTTSVVDRGSTSGAPQRVIRTGGRSD